MRSPSKSKPGLESDFKQEQTKILLSDEDVSQNDPTDIYEDSSNEVSIDTSDTSDNEKSSEKGKWYDNWRDINGGFWGCLVVLTSWSFNWTVGKYDQTTYTFDPLHVFTTDKKFRYTLQKNYKGKAISTFIIGISICSFECYLLKIT